MRRTPLAILIFVSPVFAAAASASAVPMAERLLGSWTCHAVEGKSENDTIMTLSYRRSAAWLIGEVTEDSGAVLLDVWFDDFSGTALALRRILSNDATIEMSVVEETATELKLEGELRHLLGTSARVREVFHFAGSDAFRAIWDEDSGEAWNVVLDRHCERT